MAQRGSSAASFRARRDRVAGLAEDGDHPPQVSLLVGPGPFAVDLGLDLDGDGVRGKLGDLSVGVVSAEVSGIEVDAEVRSIHGLDGLENLPRRRRDPAVFSSASVTPFLAAWAATLIPSIARAAAWSSVAFLGTLSAKMRIAGAWGWAARSIHNRVLASCSSRLGPGRSGKGRFLFYTNGVTPYSGGKMSQTKH